MSNQNDDQAPATKKDIQVIQDQLGIILKMMATKEDLQEVKKELRHEIKQETCKTKEELLLYMEQAQANLTDVIQDSASATSDRIDNHEKRIHVLEMRI
ncbi:MAG: hypothetical protein KBD00_05260 [Candidatus Peribacteraceae bacterium]|nr:hypothetical protein [Candidatus Peribacteraceae bacterium]